MAASCEESTDAARAETGQSEQVPNTWANAGPSHAGGALTFDVMCGDAGLR